MLTVNTCCRHEELSLAQAKLEGARMTPAVRITAIVCLLLAVSFFAAGVVISLRQQRLPRREAQAATARFRFAMLAGALFSLVGAVLMMFSTLY